MAYRIGLTGGIGSGKSTVSAMFSRLGVPVIDADQVARAVVEPGMPALSELEAHFGAEILSEGRLDRRHLREIIFSQVTERAWVEALLHPYIQAEILRLSGQSDQPYIVLEIPLLFEAGYRNLVDRALVIDAPEKLQIERVVARDEVSAEQVESILKSQMNPQNRLMQADDVIENSGDMGHLKEQVERLHQIYLQKA